MAGLPVFRIDWHEPRLPTLTARRAVHRALASHYAEHLLCYIVYEHTPSAQSSKTPKMIAFTWAQKRADGKTELRTLPYEVGTPARTTIERLAMLHFSLEDLMRHRPTIGQLTDKLNQAFEIESLSRQFYQEVANWFFWAAKHVEFPMPPETRNKESYTLQSLIRLLTRLLFCWFLKAKGLIPNELFDENYLQTLLTGSEPLATSRKTRFYKAILQNLFFATLNTEMEQRDWAKDGQNYMAHNLYRYKKLFKNPNKAIELLKNIPFLNGGLFECLDRIGEVNGQRCVIRIDGFSRHIERQLKVPDFLFFGEERVEELSDGPSKKRVKVRGLIRILSSYNFTIMENTPLEREVALNPELLGQVFENLLAAYNPETETGTTEREATGSYYTPQEIVEFMVDEALIFALKTKLKARFPEAKDEHLETQLRRLFAYNDEKPDFTKDYVKALICAIGEMKILDPACGSGAFLMGALQRLVFILSKLDPDNARWKALQIAKAPKNLDPTEHDEVIAAIEQSFTSNEPDYGRKLYLIQNCIYGVDIQPIAIQIAKLRFFISLIVEQEIRPEAKNLGILALPNLETRLMAADTLRRLNRSQQLTFRSPELEKLLEKLAEVHAKYFTAKTPATKQECREKDKELRAQMTECLKTDGWHDQTARLLANWDPYDQNASAPFFDPKWMLGLSTGFDIVLGNPPYIQLQKSYDQNSIYADLYKDKKYKKYKDLYKDQNYKTFDPRGDIYCLFYERGVELLREEGILAYITSNKWMRAGYGEKLRQYFVTHTNPLLLIDLGPDVFESAAVDTNILLLQRAPNQNRLRAFTYTDRTQSLRDALQTHAAPMPPLTKDAWFIGGDPEHDLKQKIERIGKPLREWDVNIYYGIKTGLNKAFIIDTDTRQSILNACEDDDERQRTEAIIKPILHGRNIKRYTYEWEGLWVIGTFPALRLDIDDFPALKKYFLDKFDIRQLEQSGKKYPNLGFNARKKTNNKWFETQDRIAYYAELKKEKLVYSEIVREPQFYYDKGKFYVEATAFLMTGSHLRYLCGLLNSRPVEFFFKRYYAGGGLGEEGYRYKKAFLEKLPIPPITPKNQSLVAQIESLVDQILAQKRGNPDADTRDLERAIDELVYRLYDLTPDEIRLIESKFK
jgi:adenine-specific DNA-methyltransferase